MSFHDPNLAKLLPQNRLAETNRQKLIKNHLPLVHKLAWRVHRQVSNAIEVDDLKQIGCLALVEAAYAFEDRGLGFSSYAKLRVRGAMIDYLRKQSDLTRSSMRFRKEMRSAELELSQRLGHKPDEVEMAQQLAMDQASYREAVDGSRTVVKRSIEQIYSDQNMCFEDGADKPPELAEKSETRQLLARLISELPDREGDVLKLYFVEEMKLEAIGEVLDIGAARVCQIKQAALARLRTIMEKHN